MRYSRWCRCLMKTKQLDVTTYKTSNRLDSDVPVSTGGALYLHRPICRRHRQRLAGIQGGVVPRLVLSSILVCNPHSRCPARACQPFTIPNSPGTIPRGLVFIGRVPSRSLGMRRGV